MGNQRQTNGSRLNVSHDFWNACLARLEQELPPQQFNTWIRALEASPDSAIGNVNLTAPNRFVLQWVRERYLHRIEQLGTEFFGKPVEILLELGSKTGKANHSAGSAATRVPPQKSGADTGEIDDEKKLADVEIPTSKPAAEAATPGNREKRRPRQDSPRAIHRQ